MDFNHTLPILLALAWLLPLASFALVVFFGPRMGRAGYYAAYVATAAIMASFVLSVAALGLWLINHPLVAAAGHGAHEAAVPPSLSGDWYVLGAFGSLRVTVGYYIDALTLCMFCMVTLVASCIHVYSFAYMHGELADVTDTLAPLSDGQPVRRRGRFCRFFQYLSLFCFSMLGLVIAGNVAMVFVFWELVGICSYLLIGFWYERQSASNAANKAFIVNRVGDFGMIVGLMAVWAGMGTFSFGDYQVVNAKGEKVAKPGIFSQVRPAEISQWRIIENGANEEEKQEGAGPSLVQDRIDNKHQLQIPNGMVREGARSQIKEYEAETNDVARFFLKYLWTMDVRITKWRAEGYGYGLLVLAGLGIFCGCVGKSAQFPLHVWLPDAMEGPTPVSALIHAATMVAAGVYLVGRFYPVFTPEVLLVIACVGCITLLLAATIALTASDIKRVLAYSTVSQLGFMMLALGLGGWLAGMFHLFTHAFFKSLLFLCSGSVIHACGTNEMPMMGGLRKKMPYTATTMLIGCLAIAGAGIPTTFIGLSGFFSKDSIIAQALSFKNANPGMGGVFFYAAIFGAGLTAFYMFRLWYMTFAGNPRDGHVYYHAHESPKTMTVPLMILAALAVVSAWNVPFTGLGLRPLLEQARPAGIEEGIDHGSIWPSVTMPSEHFAHSPEGHGIAVAAEWAAFATAAAGFLLATAIYLWHKFDPKEISRSFAPFYWLFSRKWLFDELYAFLFVRPVQRVAGWVAAFDKQGIDWLADNAARAVGAVALVDDWIDRTFVDAAVNLLARWTYALGLRLRTVQTGNIRQYVMWIVVGTVGLFVLMSWYGIAIEGIWSLITMSFFNFADPNVALTWLLSLIIFLPALGGLMLCVMRGTDDAVRWSSLLVTILVFILTIWLAIPTNSTPPVMGRFTLDTPEMQNVVRHSWIPGFHIYYSLGVDGISLPLVLLTSFLSVLAMGASWPITKNVRAYCILFLLLETGMLGVFLSLDFFLFYVFWEVMLLPMYFLIGIWGGPRREYAAIKFFLFTLVGSVLMLVAILMLYFASKPHTFDILELARIGQLADSPFHQALWGKTLSWWAFVLLLIGFIIKLPSVPFHTWLPDAHVEAPTPISMILAGVLLKMGGYGVIRICYPICPDAGHELAWFVCGLGTVSMVYGALAALAQKDFKRLVAYSSVSHMGYVLLGIGAWSATASIQYNTDYWTMGMSGAMFQMIAHGISSAGMFFLVGVVYDRVHHRDLDKFGWLVRPHAAL